MPVSPELLKTIRPQHEQANVNLRKVIGGAGKRQGNFFVVVGKNNAALALTLSHKDPTANQVKSKGKKLRNLLKTVETTRFAQGTVTMAEGNWLTFTMLSGNARPAQIKQMFRDSALWKELGFPKPDLLKRARVQGKTLDAGGEVEEEVVPRHYDEDSGTYDEVSFNATEIEEAAAYHFGELPDIGALFESAAEIEAANAGVVEMLYTLDGDRADLPLDDLELLVLQGVDVMTAVETVFPDADTSIPSQDKRHIEKFVREAYDEGPQTGDLEELSYWLLALDEATKELERRPDMTQSDPQTTAAVTYHFVQRRQARAIKKCQALFNALDDKFRGEDGPTVYNVAGRSDDDWRAFLNEASKAAFENDPTRLWDPATVAAAEAEILAFDEDAPKGLDDWQAPDESASRTRCPFLNLSANHGWIPRSGWTSYPQLRKALIARSGLDATTADFLTSAAFKQAGVRSSDGTEMLNLSDLRYSTIFHPGGLAHEDTTTSPDPELVEELIEVSADGEYLTEEDVKVAMRARHDESGDVGLFNMPFAFGETFLIFNLLSQPHPETGEMVVRADDMRDFLAKNRFPESLAGKATDPDDPDEGLLDAIIGIADVAVDTYLPLFSSSVKDRVAQVRAQRTLRDAIKRQPEGLSFDEVDALLAPTPYIQDLDASERAEGIAGLLEHMARVGVIIEDPDGKRWYPGDKLFPPEG